MFKLITIVLVVVFGCTPDKKREVNPNCVGNDGNAYSCSSGSCSKTGGKGCSTPTGGVYCCSGGSGGGGGNDGTNMCPLGYCWTIENICCPKGAPYPCKGYCYTTNTCKYTSLRTACHDW